MIFVVCNEVVLTCSNISAFIIDANASEDIKLPNVTLSIILKNLNIKAINHALYKNLKVFLSLLKRRIQLL